MGLIVRAGILADGFAFHVHINIRAINRADFGVFAQKRNLLLQFVRRPPIIVFYCRHELALRFGEHAVATRRNAAVFISAKHAHARIFGGVFLCDVKRLRRFGCVVHNNEFKIAEGMTQHALYRLPHKLRAVVEQH